MRFLEKDLEDIIFNAPNEDLRKRGLFIGGKKLRQVRIGNYGIADLITVNFNTEVCDGTVTQYPVVTVYELKKDSVNGSTFTQLLRYVKGVKRYCDINYEFNVIVKGVMIGSSTSDDIIYLPCVSDFRTYNYNYNYDGIKFLEKKGFVLTNEGF
tara:strand:- start:590 stop:1051 length:462 start_codon:yes stop_codon:yes gene_type:complete